MNRVIAWTAAVATLLPLAAAAQAVRGGPPPLPTTSAFGGVAAGLVHFQTGIDSWGFAGSLQLLAPAGPVVLAFAGSHVAGLFEATCEFECSTGGEHATYLTAGARVTRPLDASRFFAGVAGGFAFRSLGFHPTAAIEAGSFIPVRGGRAFLVELRGRFDRFRMPNVGRANRTVELALGLLWRL